MRHYVRIVEHVTCSKAVLAAPDTASTVPIRQSGCSAYRSPMPGSPRARVRRRCADNEQQETGTHQMSFACGHLCTPPRLSDRTVEHQRLPK